MHWLLSVLSTCWLCTTALLSVHATEDRHATTKTTTTCPLLSAAKTHLIQQNLLKMMGMASRPASRRNKPVLVPQYMLDMYEDENRNYGANTVRSHPYDLSATVVDHTGYQLRFNVTIPDTEMLLAAELRIYLGPLNATTTTTTTSKRGLKQRVNVHQINSIGLHDELVLQLLDTKSLDVKRQSEWLTFDVLPAVQRWLANPYSNKGIHVSLITGIAAVERKDNDERLHGDDVPIDQLILSKQGVHKLQGGDTTSYNEYHLQEDDTAERLWHKYKPILMTYSKEKGGVASDAMKRTKRSPMSSSMHSKSKPKRARKREACRRHSLYIDFKEVGWSDWIVAPNGYDAYFCHGDCPFPLSDHLNSTNHAIVQTLVNSVNPASVPKACCVPTELSSISMLYVDDDDKVVLKNYQDMVVEGCGCR